VYEYVIDYGGGAAVIVAETQERAVALGQKHIKENTNYNEEDFYNILPTKYYGFYLVETLDSMETKERVVLLCRGDG
jgi:hypothetical protein